MRNSATLITSALAAIVLTATLGGCASGTSQDAGGSDSGSGSGKIAFLMPDLASTRYEQQDSPLFTAKMAELCPDCEVIYQNADSDASKQQQQADSAIAQGASVIVLDAVDTKAAASIVANAQGQDVAVITYDRPIVDRPADFYVSFDNEGIGEAIAASLVDHLETENAQGGILIVNGSPTDDAAQLIKKGIHTGVDDSGFETLAEFDTPDWDPQKAQDWVSGQVTQFEGQIAGVVAANDGTAGGSVAALNAAGLSPLPPVTGNDAEIAAIQRIVAGQQYNTISKPIKTVAEAAAEAAFAFISGDEPTGDTTLYDTAAQLFEPTVVTAENVKAVIFDGGIYTADQVCTGEYASGCAALGIN